MREPGSRDQDLPIRDFAGVNRLDGGENLGNNNFLTLQNWYHATKRVLYKRKGSTEEIPSIEGASAINGIHRCYDPDGKRMTLYTCKPTTDTIPSPTIPPTLTEVTSVFPPGPGTLFNGGAITAMTVSYSWVGMGGESPNTGTASITLVTATNYIRATVPAFPSGIRSANVFLNGFLVGSITTSAGSIDILNYLAPGDSSADTLPVPTVFPADVFPGNGFLTPGLYYVALGWFFKGEPKVGPAVSVVLTQGQTTIAVGIPALVSTNGATSLYVFISRKDPKYFPMNLAGIALNFTEFQINRYPKNSNAQTLPINIIDGVATDTQTIFVNGPGSLGIAGTDRSGFVIKKDYAGDLTEVFMSRSEKTWGINGNAKNPFQIKKLSETYTGHNARGVLFTDNDTASLGDLYAIYPRDWSKIVGGKYYDPTFCDVVGTVIFTNGWNLPIQTDGNALSSIVEPFGTILPPLGGFLINYENQIIMGGSDCGAQVYASNAYTPNNWVVGGTGSALRFMSVGNSGSEPVTGLAIFGFTTGTEGPKSYIMATKAVGSWVYSGFADPTTGGGVSLTQLSGRVGTFSYRSFTNTPLGLMFVGTDGDVYLARGQGEPFRFGTRVKNFLEHLLNNEALGRLVTACFHEDHLKIAYPSSSASTFNDAQLWADLRISQGEEIKWSGPHVGVNVGPQIALIGEGDTSTRLCALSDEPGTAYLDDSSSYQDRGIAITSIVESKQYRFRSEERLKRFLGLIMETYFDTTFNHTLLVEGFADDQYAQINIPLSSGGATWDASNYDASLWSDAAFVTIRKLFGPDNLVGTKFKFKITHSDNAPIIISMFKIPYQSERRQFI